MILYCDTSALMKLFVEEQHTDTMRRLAKGSTHIVVSQLAWVEMCAGLSLKQRARQVDAPLAQRALAELRAQWARYHKLGVDQEIVSQAGALAQRFGLRAYDSVQLASAQRTHSQAGSGMSFACFDKQLGEAARAIGMNALSV